MRRILIALLFCATPLLAQDTAPAATDAADAAEPASEETTNRVDLAREALENTPTVAPPSAEELLFLDEDGRAALVDSLEAYYRYRESGFQHRRDVFDWQLQSSRIIFYMVVLLVAVGVYFSWVQFTADQKAQKRAAAGKADAEKTGDVTAQPDAPPAKAPVTTFEAGSGGIKVSSPVLGVIILVISLAFFYVYLIHVHPITELF